LRIHQWVKNLIVFVPLLAAHKIGSVPLLLKAAGAFGAFCLCASAVYLLNDLLDLDADRHHPTKKMRPFAAGDLPIATGLVLAPLLCAAGLWLACSVSWSLGAVLALYLVLTTTYSWRIKEIALLDVFFLAALYSVRLVAGHEATRDDGINVAPVVEYSFWLLVFSMFLFLSLALVKRFHELDAARRHSRTDVKGRGYVAHDLELVASLGSSSGYLAVLVMALYVNSQQVRVLYLHPTVLLLVCPLLLYWISRIWMIAHRGQMHDDPIVFALKDRTSYLIGVLTLAVLWLATGR
jgi:4-hydroxybenzoate polyprenyltransferase